MHNASITYTSLPKGIVSLSHSTAVPSVAESFNTMRCEAGLFWSTELGAYNFTPNVQDITGHSAAHSYGSRWHKRFLSESFEKFCVACDRLQTTHESQDTIKVMMRDGYGQFRHYCLTIRFVGISRSGSATFAILQRDIQQEQQSEQQRKELFVQAAMATRGRSEFLANMHHELRTPLNAIIGFATMMEDEVFGEITNPKYREYITAIRHSSSGLLNKISDVLEISEMESGRMEMRESLCNVSDMVEDVIGAHHGIIDRKKLDITCQHQRHSVVIRGDRIKLTRALDHLLTNAIDHSEEGNEILIRSSVQPDKSLHLSIADTGCGISEEHLQEIKQGLDSAKAFFATQPNGIRLGLALSKEFLTLHGAELEIESTLGRGTIASIMLPAHRVSSVSARVKPKVAKQREILAA